ncbi:zeta toxin family protein [Phaeodactylibacter xiamenensis]|uniref:zeta toxin family protein n=1 Tax=Phaeodactylibacter xiamenensis TaxID=1524460 RepID=UPI003BA867AF
MKSKAQAYIKTMGMDTESLPQKYQENFEAMRDFEEILDIAQPGSEDYKEALSEWEDYDEQILAALKKDYPAQQGYGGTLRWNWVREGEEVRVDWDHPERYVDGRYYIMLPKPAEGKLATYEKVGEGDIEFPGQDKRIQELLARAPQWVKAKTPNPEEKEGLANVNREFRQYMQNRERERTKLPDSLPYMKGDKIVDVKGREHKVYLVVDDVPLAISTRHQRDDGHKLTFLEYYDREAKLWKNDGEPYYHTHAPTEAEIRARPRGFFEERSESMPPVDEKGNRRIDSQALDALEAHLEKLPQTKDLHSEYGEYTDERKKLHDKIIKEEVEGNTCIRREAPIAILTGGLPGSGKSTYIRNNKDWMDNPAIFKVDADDIRAKLPEYEGWNASQTHNETQDIVKTLLGKVGKFGCSYDVIYDGTMNKSKKYKPLIEVLKKEGYRVFIMFLKVDKATSLERAMGRYQKSGRYVPRFVIEEGVQNGLTAFEELKGMVDGYVLIDGKTQKVLEKGGAEIPDDRDYSKLDDQPSQKTSKPKPGKKAKKVYKKDYYAAMDKAHPGLSKAQVKGMKQKEYEALMDKLEQGAKDMGLTAKKASEYAEAYVSVHLPKGSTAQKPKGFTPPPSMEVFLVMDQPGEPGQYDLEDADLYLSKEKALSNKDEGIAVRASLDIEQWIEDNELSFESEKDLLKEVQQPGWSWDGVVSIEEEIDYPEYTLPESIKAYGVLSFVDKEEDYYEYDTLSIEFDKGLVVKTAKDLGQWAVELDFKAAKWLDRLKQEGGPVPVIQSVDDLKTEIRGGGYEYDEGIVTIGKVLHNPDDLSNLRKSTGAEPSAGTKPSFSWRTAADTSKLMPMLNHCQEYALKVDKDLPVQLKGTGKESITVTAQKGEYLIFDDKGHLVYVMNAASFKRKCIENTTLEKHLKEKHQTAPKPNDRPLPKALEKYRGVFGDYDGDGVLNVDDPDPYTPGDGTTVEEVKLADEIEKIIDFRKDYDTARNEFVEILKKHAEGETDILSRTKTPYSIINKLRRKRLAGKKGLTDVIGTMVVFPDQKSLEDFKDKVNAGKLGEVLEFDDYYKKPQAGYRAYHWNVVYKGSPVEIQAKTERVKKIAKANHTLYKEGKDDAEKLGALMLLANQADKGDQAAMKKIDPVLKDPKALKQYLTEKKMDTTKATKQPDAPKADKQSATPKAASKPAPKAPDKAAPEGSCTAEELTTAQKVAKIMKMVDENTMVWSDIFDTKQWKKTREIEGIYELRAEADKGKIIVKVRDWSAKGKKEAEKWYSLCIDSYRLTKIDTPPQGSYRSVVSKSQLQAAYTTKGERKYRKCAALHSELAKCRMKGNCTTEQRERYKKEVDTCGNLAKTKVGVPKYVIYLHAETKKRRKKGEAYSDALARVAEELRKAAA